MVELVEAVSMEQKASLVPPTHLTSALSPAGGLCPCVDYTVITLGELNERCS